MTPEIKRAMGALDEAISDCWRTDDDCDALKSAAAAERAAWEALLRDIIQAAGVVVQEAKHHELMPWFQQKIDELERVTTIGGQP